VDRENDLHVRQQSHWRWLGGPSPSIPGCTVARRGTPGSQRILIVSFLLLKGLLKVTREEERIRELVELIASRNGTNEVLALAEELKVLVDARKKRLKGNPLSGPPIIGRL